MFKSKKQPTKKVETVSSGAPKSLPERLRQELRYRDRIIGMLFILLILGGVFVATMPSRLTVFIPPDTSKSMLVRLNDVPHPSVYTFAHMFLEHLNYCPKDCKTDFLDNLHSMHSLITDQCRATLENHVQRQGDLYMYRSRKLVPIVGEVYRPNKVIQRSDRAWVVNETYELEERIRGTEIRKTRLFYPMRIVRVDMPIDINPYQMQFDCFEGSPIRVDEHGNEIVIGAGEK